MLSVLAVGLCVVVLSSIESVNSSVTVQRSSVVIFGERVELKCSVTGNDSASWKYTSWNSSTETNIYLGRDILISMRSRYKIDKRIRGQNNLIIDSADLAHGGRYRCTGVQQPLINDVQLIVLDPHPVCFENTSEADVTTKEQRRLHRSIWCSISYTGNGFPVFIWTKSNAENISANTANSGACQLSFTSTSLITQQLQSNDSGVTFYCLITFKTPNQFTEKNTGVLEYTWKYSLYGPSDLNIVEYEDRLECSADGNPTPVYTWIDDEANIALNGSLSTLNLTNDKEHILYCTAENIFASVRKYYTIKDVSNSPIWLTTLAIVGFLPVPLIIIIISACVVYRKRVKGASSVRPDVALNTDLTSYDDIALSSQLSPNYILAGDPSAGRSDERMISDNAVYAEVCKPTGPSTGNKRRNTGDNSRSLQHPTRVRKDLIGDDGTEYVNMGEERSTDRKGVRHVSDPIASSHETIYTSIDHSGRVPAHLPKW